MKKEEILKNKTLDNIDKARELSKAGYYDEAIKYCHKERAKYQLWNEEFENIEYEIPDETRFEGKDSDNIDMNNYHYEKDEYQPLVIDNRNTKDTIKVNHLTNDSPGMADLACFEEAIILEKKKKYEEALDLYQNALDIHQNTDSGFDDSGYDHEFEELCKNQIKRLKGKITRIYFSTELEYYEHFKSGTAITILLISELNKDFEEVINTFMTISPAELSKSSMWQLTRASNYYDEKTKNFDIKNYRIKEFKENYTSGKYLDFDCPKCGKKEVKRLIYDFPFGRVALTPEEIYGGCCMKKNSPDRLCENCGYVWKLEDVSDLPIEPVLFG